MRTDFATLRSPSRANFRASVAVLAAMFRHGGRFVTINATDAGTPVMARLLLQPDADTVVMVDTLYATDLTLSARVMDEIERLMLELDQAQSCVHAVLQAGKVAGLVTLALLVPFGSWALSGLLDWWATALAFPVLVLTLRPLAKWALRRWLARAAPAA